MDMWYILGVVCLAIYMFCSLWFLLGSIIQLHLLLHARSGKQGIMLNKDVPDLPFVTIQVPVYNERYVIQRLLQQLTLLNYPTDRFEIQILDDSTDDTRTIVDDSVNKMIRTGINAYVIRRNNRVGYKAGALQYALPLAKGDLIAIFDADFIPAPGFLKRMVHHFADNKVGGVQARWTHDNLEQNVLTRIQAFLLDSHFQLEQKGRSAAGYFLNFNGTAGIWRKACIVDSGGWNGAVLTEDLELSYRAQLKGWIFHYDNSVTVPAELPADFNAFKSQQFRWAKGMSQTASKHLAEVLKSDVRFAKKLHATFHLLGSMSFVAVMGNIIMALPLIAGRKFITGFHELTNIIVITGVTLPLICIYYYFGTASTLSRKMFWRYLPMYLMIYMALSVQNTIAVLQGLWGKTSPFVRTPKTNGSSNVHDRYLLRDWTSINSFELMSALYILAAIFLCIYWGDYLLLMFLLMVFTGLSVLLSQSLQFWKPWFQPTSGKTIQTPPLSG